ncbi:MAG: aldehyde dehydrogenase [Spirochaetes bacterium]|nr:MAG: aldehyde dehydrogenase [Spirochaetota bacterium]
MHMNLKCYSPIDGSLYVERETATSLQVEQALTSAHTAQKEWRKVPVSDRCSLAGEMITSFKEKKGPIAEELTWMMGRPIRYTQGEIDGFVERALYMTSIAESSLSPVKVEEKEGFDRFIRHEPLGVALVIAPWNYPYLTAVNAFLPAILAGNTVLLKHSSQTPLCAERLQEAFDAAGFPEGVFKYLHLSHEETELLIKNPLISHVAFTGSVSGGSMVERAAAGRFISVGLELGGKDPSYVRADADIDQAVETVIDGAFFNSGQSCCGIERAYVAAEVYDEFISKAADLVKQYKLGRPDNPETTLGPVVRPEAASFIRMQVDEAIAQGAKSLIDTSIFPEDKEGSAYLAPQILVDVNHDMRVMREETFGPVLGIQKVQNDEEALKLMNDSEFGLTACLFTRNYETGIELGDRLETGTFFINRCDYLDPALAWTGVKNSGRGVTLSAIGYEYVTRPKSFHIKKIS